MSSKQLIWFNGVRNPNKPAYTVIVATEVWPSVVRTQILFQDTRDKQTQGLCMKYDSDTIQLRLMDDYSKNKFTLYSSHITETSHVITHGINHMETYLISIIMLHYCSQR